MLRGWAVDLAWVTLAGVFFGLIGPFGSFFNGPAWQRVVYWVAMAWLGLAVYGSGQRLVMARVSTRPAVWLALAAMVLIVSVPFAGVTWAVSTAIWPALRLLPNLTSVTWYLEVIAITAPQVALFALAAARRGRRDGQRAAPAPAPGLLGVPLGETLCLQMEDHYIRVHTAAGSRLVLATMGQAITALGPERGLRVHRSWWVAERAVAGAVVEGRNLRLVLTNGVTAPVARASVVNVRQAGWLDRDDAAATGIA